MFLNDILATPSGVKVGSVREDAGPIGEPVLSDAQRRLVDDVVARYGSMSDDRLAGLVRDSEPWREGESGGWVVAPEVIRDEFMRLRQVDQ